MVQRVRQHHNVRINYRSIGSGNGMREVLARSVDFGATHVPMSDAELAEAGRKVVHVPTVLGAVAIIYNLPTVEKPLRLTAGLLADIFLGRITRGPGERRHFSIGQLGYVPLPMSTASRVLDQLDSTIKSVGSTKTR